ncbi:MAG: hypothetical protein IJN37_04450 [Clostridia bacterium]|nr:hypothetical protein [Clostridia bacterium]
MSTNSDYVPNHISNSRIYTTGKVIYASDMAKILRLQYEIGEVVKGTSSIVSLETVISAVGSAVTAFFGIFGQTAETAAEIIFSICGAKVPDEKEAIKDLIMSGYGALTELNLYFSQHTNVEAVEVSALGFLELFDENNHKFTAVCSNEYGSFTGILINGTWNRP